MKTFNLNSDEWDGTRDREGWRAKGALVGQHIGGELIGDLRVKNAPVQGGVIEGALTAALIDELPALAVL